MKKAILFLAFSAIAICHLYAQSNSKLVVMITRANWCPTCRANENKIKNELIPAYSNSTDVTIVMNDITNHKSKEKSKPQLVAYHVLEQAQNEQATGTILLIDKSSGKILEKRYVSDPIADIKKAIDASLTKL